MLLTIKNFETQSYDETALKPARGPGGGGGGGAVSSPAGSGIFSFFEDKMHRLVTLQVVTPKLHTVPMRTIGRDGAEIL